MLLVLPLHGKYTSSSGNAICTGKYRFQRIADLPNVARFRAASTASASKLASVLAPSVTFFNAVCGSLIPFRLDLLQPSDLSGAHRRSISKTSLLLTIHLEQIYTHDAVFAPSMRACFSAAAASMRNFGIPFSMADAIPPSASISCMSSRAASRI